MLVKIFLLGKWIVVRLAYVALGYFIAKVCMEKKQEA